MNRRDELQAALGCWGTLRDDIDFDVIPDNEWPLWVEHAQDNARQNQKWFQIGIARAVNELKSNNADGTPRWPSRQALINHLLQINEPN